MKGDSLTVFYEVRRKRVKRLLSHRSGQSCQLNYEYIVSVFTPPSGATRKQHISDGPFSRGR